MLVENELGNSRGDTLESQGKYEESSISLDQTRFPWYCNEILKRTDGSGCMFEQVK